jgi:large subunit ribosomal protein L15
MKKHRGAGHRGGRGNAGSGKRADCKKPSIWGDTDYFGKIGFSSKSRAPDINAINLRTIDEQLDSWVAAGLAKKNGEEYTIDLTAAGFNKVLSGGQLTKKCAITVDFASDTVTDKCKQSGSSVMIRFPKKDKEAEKAAKAAKAKKADGKQEKESSEKTED